MTNGEVRIQRKFDDMGGSATFGDLASKEEGTIWTFVTGACICYNEQFAEAFEIHGAIYAKWLEMGGLGWTVPETDELPTLDGAGRFNHFSSGSSIFWSPETGAHSVYGAIREKWASVGWERHYLGYPVTDELGTPDGVGRFNHFTGGSIYWTPNTWAHIVNGVIRSRWEELGWESSYLGYPTTDEADLSDGGRANEFERGGIYWWPDTGAIDLRDVVIHYTGLHAFGETDYDQGSSSDEPYVIISVSTPNWTDTKTTRVYSDVDGGEARPDVLEVYRGKPYGINVASVVMEHDEGDPDRYKKEVQDVVMGVHKAGTLALGLIPVVGPAIAAVAGPALGALMPSIGGAINDLFDWGDDRIGGAKTTLSARQMVLLAARTQQSSFKGIGFKVESPLVSGSGASYKAYFNVLPA